MEKELRDGQKGVHHRFSPFCFRRSGKQSAVVLRCDARIQRVGVRAAKPSNGGRHILDLRDSQAFT